MSYKNSELILTRHDYWALTVLHCRIANDMFAKGKIEHVILNQTKSNTAFKIKREHEYWIMQNNAVTSGSFNAVYGDLCFVSDLTRVVDWGILSDTWVVPRPWQGSNGGFIGYLTPSATLLSQNPTHLKYESMFKGNLAIFKNIIWEEKIIL